MITQTLISFLNKQQFSKDEKKDLEYLSEKINHYAENMNIEFSDEEVLNLAKQYSNI